MTMNVLDSVHKNKLTQCFDDILEVSAQMLVQQQLKSIQLDFNVVNGFSQTQQNILRDKINTFHAILDDLETTLGKSKLYAEELLNIGREKELARQKGKQEEEEKKRLLAKAEQEEEAKKQKILDESKKEQASLNTSENITDIIDNSNNNGNSYNNNNANNNKPIKMESVSSNDKLDFFFDTPTDLLADFTGKYSGGIVTQLADNNDTISSTKSLSPVAAKSKIEKPTNDDNPTTFEDSNNLNMSIFPGLDNGGFDLENFGSLDVNNVDDGMHSLNENINPDNTSKSVHMSTINDNSGIINDTDPLSLLAKNQKNAASSKSNNNDMALPENPDDYLTLNDFNDLNIEWSNTGDPADLDLNEFSL